MQSKNLKKNFVCVMPMAGEGNRFKKYGYITPKPLIKIKNEPMFLKAVKSFPRNLNWVFIANEKINLKKVFKKYSNTNKKNFFLILKKRTQGQASTVYKSLKYLNKTDKIIVHSCDLAFKIDFDLLKKKIDENDLLVFTARGSNYHFKNHKQFSWVKNDRNGCKISIKKRFKKKKNTKVLIGSFVFKNKVIMKKLLEYTFQKKMRVKKEYYMDTLMKVADKLGYKLDEFVVKKYISWGSHKEFLKYNKR